MQDTKLYYKNTMNGKNELMSLDKKEKIEDDTCSKNINIKYENSKNRIEVIIKQEDEIVNDFEEIVNLDNKNSILINNLEENQLKSVLDKVTDKVSQKCNILLESTIKIDDFKKVLENIINLEDINIDNNIEEVTEPEKNRFNSQFEILKANELEKEEVIKIIEIIKNNLVGIKLESNTILKLELSRNENDENISDTIINYIEKIDKKYNIDIEYDNQTGLAKYIVLEIAEEE